MRQIAIIAPTASGKTALAIEVAHKIDAIILSFDSLAVYKNIDIASAKPTLSEREGIVHFGIDEINPDDMFDVTEFIKLYTRAKNFAIQHNKNLIIVGGTGFYLKALIDGISEVPTMTQETIEWVEKQLQNLEDAYKFMVSIDDKYMKKIASTDKYRIEKALSIYKQTNETPTDYFQKNQPKPIIDDIQIYEIFWSVEDLKKRIEKRTSIMLEDGLIDEVIYLEKRYTREPNCMKTIGISETLEYLDGKISKEQLVDKITLNTIKLAKRQRTFNNGQFKNIIKSDLKSLRELLNRQ
jgi:tRNA dimethylallyltransferase